MCTHLHRPDVAAHWRLARRLASAFECEQRDADARVDAIAAQIRYQLERGADAPRAAARAAIQHLRVLPDDACTSVARLLPDAAATRGRGHELACSIALLEAARRAGADARLATSRDELALLVGDHRGWGAIVPRLGAVDWVPMPVSAAIDGSWAPCCAHDTSRMLVSLLAPVLPSDQLHVAMSLVDELTAA